MNIIDQEKDIKDNTEEDLEGSLYKYSRINMESNCCKCFECNDCKKERNKRNKRVESKFQGEVYFASPLEFNDIIDSQLEVNNNASCFNDDKLSLKLRELFSDVDDKVISDINNKLKESNYSDTVKQVREEQLKKTGILCFTTNNVNATMWGYYADNKGVCIEYDTNNLIYDIITNFASEMSKELTELLIEKKYTVKNRDIESKPNRTEYARKIFNNEKEIVESLKKNSVLSRLEPKKQKYFVQNLHTKRLWGKKVVYHIKDDINKIKPNLFENKKTRKIFGKYFAKDEFWKHEQEYRFILSLGGGETIKLRQGTIKSITFGANTSNETIKKIKKILRKDIEIYKIVVENNSLKASPYNSNGEI